MSNKLIKIFLTLFIICIFINIVNAEYSIIVMSKDYDINTNITVYQNGSLYKQIYYGDSFNYSNNGQYRILIHEDKFDEMSNINNLESLMNRNITLIIFITIIVMIIGFISYFGKRQKE